MVPWHFIFLCNYRTESAKIYELIAQNIIFETVKLMSSKKCQAAVSISLPNFLSPNYHAIIDF